MRIFYKTLASVGFILMSVTTTMNADRGLSCDEKAKYFDWGYAEVC